MPVQALQWWLGYAQVTDFAKLQERPLADEVGGTCSTGIECAKVQLL